MLECMGKREVMVVQPDRKTSQRRKPNLGTPMWRSSLHASLIYYGGLTEAQLKVSFENLLKQDDPSDYDHWVRDCPSVPGPLRNYTGINLKSSEQWTMLLVPLFSRNHATIGFFLARVVFPKEAKEFPSKLACSGWGLAEKKERLLTGEWERNLPIADLSDCILGFSETNDGQCLFPLNITQRDPDH